MANEKRLIDANAVIAEIMKAQDSLKTNNDALWNINSKYFKGLAWAHRIVLDAPTIDAVEVVHGRWVEQRDIIESYLSGCTKVFYVCSVCESGNIGKSPYCPDCGAKMDGDGNA